MNFSDKPSISTKQGSVSPASLNLQNENVVSDRNISQSKEGKVYNSIHLKNNSDIVPKKMNKSKKITHLRNWTPSLKIFSVFWQAIKSIGKSATLIALEKNLSDILDIDKKQLNIKQLSMLVSEVAKGLHEGQSEEFALPGLENHKFLIIKDVKGKFDLIFKEKLLGEGSCGKIFEAVSIMTRERIALKYATASPEIQHYLQNEVRSLEIINENSSVEGVQEILKVSYIKDGKVKKVITKGRLYSHGDLQTEVVFLRMARILGIKSERLKLLETQELTPIIEEKINRFSDKLWSLINSRNYLIKNKHSKIDESTNELDFELANIKKKIDEISDEIKELGQSIYLHLFGKEKAFDFCCKIEEFLETINSSTNTLNHENINLLSKTLLRIPFLDAVNKCKELPALNIREKAALAANLISGMRHIHNKGFIHGDIKPANFFWDGSRAVIADFGGSQSKAKPKNILYTEVYSGNACYRAMVDYNKKGKKQPDNWFRAGLAHDIKAMGLSLYTIFTGDPIPSEEDFNNQVHEQIRDRLLEEGMPLKAASLLATMCDPVKFEKNPLPDPFPSTWIDDDALAELIMLLKDLDSFNN